MLPLPRQHKNNSLIAFSDSSGCRVALLTLSLARLLQLGIRRDEKGTKRDNEILTFLNVTGYIPSCQCNASNAEFFYR